MLDLNLPGLDGYSVLHAAPLAARHAGDSGHGAHRQGRRGQRGAGVRARRRRLHDQAVPGPRPVGTARGGPRPPPRLTRPPLSATSSDPRPTDHSRLHRPGGQRFLTAVGRPRPDQARRSGRRRHTRSGAARPPKAQPEREPLRLPARTQAGGARARRPRAPWQRYPEFVPTGLLERLAAHYGWIARRHPGRQRVQRADPGDARGRRSAAGDVGRGALADFLALPACSPACSAAATSRCRSGQHFEFDVDALIRDRGAGAGTGGRAQLAQQPDRLRAARGRGRARPRRDRCAGRVRRGLPGLRRARPRFHCSRRSSRLVVLRTFSKAMGMAGLRFGLALAHPAVARELAKGKLPYNVNLVTLAAADVALDHGRAARRADPARSSRPRDRFLSAARRAPGDRRCFPSAANFVLIRCRARPGARGVPPAATRSTASWCATSPASASWRSACGSRSARRRTWTRWRLDGILGVIGSAGRRGDRDAARRRDPPHDQGDRSLRAGRPRRPRRGPR